jgi:hypothetical protein
LRRSWPIAPDSYLLGPTHDVLSLAFVLWTSGLRQNGTEVETRGFLGV